MMKGDTPLRNMLPVLSSILSWRRLPPLSTILAAFALLLLLWHVRSTSFSLDSYTSSKEIHPIYRRMLDANSTYHALLKRQSKTLGQARKEYARRYRAPPPDGFDQWFVYATDRKSMIIDDFDVINEKLEPFRPYLKGGCSLQLLDAKYLGDNHILQICIRDGKLFFHGEEQAEWIMDAFKEMVNPFLDKLVNPVCVLMNLLDEPRILLSRDRVLQKLKEPKEEKQHAFCPVPSFISYEKQNWWSEAVLPCSPTSPARSYSGETGRSNDGEHSDDFQSTSDLCSYSKPPEHGVLLSPSSLFATHSVVPIISNAALSTFSDIFFPSIWRFDLYSEYNRTEDIPWAQKVNNGYWRGSTTGGMARSDKWEKFQRHRFVEFANSESNGLRNSTDVKFSNLVQCEDEDACQQIVSHFELDRKRPFSDTWKSKIVFDIDGNGLSGRFYPLLRSNSAVFRQSIFREWHDGRIFPWIHYVPLSLEFTELKELMDFYLGDGEVLLERVAIEGRKMAESVLRRDDMRIYLYRLLVEMGIKE